MIRRMLIFFLVLGLLSVSDRLLHAGLVSGLGRLTRLTEEELRSSSWSIAGTLKVKIQNSGKTQRPMTGKLFFGPQDVSLGPEDTTLADHEFLLSLDDGDSRILILGNYSVPGFLKKPVLSPDAEIFAEELQAFFQETAPGARVDVLSVRSNTLAKGKKRGDTVKIKLKTKFLVIDGETLKGTLSYKGEGSRAP